RLAPPNGRRRPPLCPFAPVAPPPDCCPCAPAPVSANSIFAYPRTEHLGNHDAAVGLLVVLENGDNGPRYRDGCSVESVGELGSLGLGGLVANAQPPRLVIGAIRRRSHLAELPAFAAAGHP